MPDWNWDNFYDIEYITVADWVKQGVNVAFSSRLGGLGSSPYASLNMGLHVGDQNEKVIGNRQRLLQIFASDLNHMICCQQVHSATVTLVDQSLAGRGARDLASALPDCDGMICNTPGLVLATFYADCFPVFFFDPVQRAVGLVHSGWKGSMGRIAAVALQKLQAACGSSPENIEVLIGPGIESCCFHIQADLAQRAQEEFSGFSKIICREHDHYTWDLKNTIRQTLIQAGCRPEHISSCDLCTACHPELFFSYRRDNGTTGRMGAFIGLQY